MSNLYQSSIPIYYTSAYDEKILKGMGIRLISTKTVTKIGKLEVRKNVLSLEARDANPVLMHKESISDIPVWVITFKGLLPDDYVPDKRGKQPMDISSTVIDAITGKALFGFGTGK